MNIKSTHDFHMSLNSIASLIAIFLMALYSQASLSLELSQDEEITMQLIEFDELNELTLQDMTRISIPPSSTNAATQKASTKNQNLHTKPNSTIRKKPQANPITR